MRALLFLLALCAAVHAQGAARKKETEDQRLTQKVHELARELRELATKSPSGLARTSDQKRLLAEIAKVNHPHAVRTLVSFVEDPDYAALREELLRYLTEMPAADEAIVGQVMRAHISADGPARGIARDYLLKQALRRRKDEWPFALFYATAGGIEDKFLALQVMGRIESEHTIECATHLANNRNWKPDATGLVSCGTIATSVERFEGPAAARLLITLTKDPRFAPADVSRVRDAMRTWRETDLRTYVSLSDLCNGDALKRQETATFLGAGGLESARAPLLRVAFNRSEVPEVRAAAASALGGLRVAREDLADRLATLLRDPERLVRIGAVEGLGRLKAIRGLEALVSMLDGPHAEEGRAALARYTGQPPEADWKAWLEAAKASEAAARQ